MSALDLLLFVVVVVRCFFVVRGEAGECNVFSGVVVVVVVVVVGGGDDREDCCCLARSVHARFIVMEVTMNYSYGAFPESCNSRNANQSVQWGLGGESIEDPFRLFTKS